jgi:hypothetical protein
MADSLTTQELLLTFGWTALKVIMLGLIAKRLSTSSYLWLRVVAVVLAIKAVLDIIGGIALFFKIIG